VPAKGHERALVSMLSMFAPYPANFFTYQQHAPSRSASTHTMHPCVRMLFTTSDAAIPLTQFCPSHPTPQGDSCTNP
jgi:hypothetical protein